MIYYAQILMLVYILFSAGHDSDTNRLKDKIGDSLTLIRLKRWHRNGAIEYGLFCAVLVYFISWKLVIATFLIRLSFFDLAVNKWSDYSVSHIGTTAATDKRFRKIFGANGAVVKSIVFFIILIILNLLNHFF